jgi:hypothetical protein
VKRSLETGWIAGRSKFDPRQRRKYFTCSLCIRSGSEARPASCTICATKMKLSGLRIFRLLYFVTQSIRWSLEFVVGDCYGQSLAVKYCLGVQNNTWIVKVIKDDYTPTYWFSVLGEFLTELRCSSWSICVTSIVNRIFVKESITSQY